MILNFVPAQTPCPPAPGETVIQLRDMQTARAASPWQLLRLVRRGRHEQCRAVVSDLTAPQRFFFIKLLCLLVRARKRLMVDAAGRTQPVTWAGFLGGDVPEFIVDALNSAFVLRRVRSRLAALEQAPVETRPLTQPAGSAHYYRTDLFFGLKAGGSVGHITGVAAGLTQAGYPVTVYAADPLEFLRAKQIPVRVVSAGHQFRNFPEVRHFAYHLQFTETLDEIIRRSAKPAFIYQRLSLNNFAGAALAQAHAVPLILEYNGSEVWVCRHWGNTDLSLAPLSLRAEQVLFRHATVIVVVSDALREELVSRGVPADKILVNPNGVDPQMYSPDRFSPAELQSVRAELKLPAEAIVACFIGTFSAWHGVEVLAEAIPLVLRLAPKMRFLLIGDGPLLDDVRQRLAAAGVLDVCVLTGLVPQAQAPRLLASCDLFLSPHVPNPDGSRFFGSPTKLFEYMALGKAIVASDLEQIGEVLVHEQTALLVRPGDTVQLAEAIVRLANDEPLRRSLGERARLQAVAEHTWDRHVERILAAARRQRD